MISVIVPSQLYSYTGGTAHVHAAGENLRALFDDLHRQYPGISFRVIDELGRIRTHQRVFVNGERALDLAVPLKAGDEVHIFGALTGGCASC